MRTSLLPRQFLVTILFVSALTGFGATNLLPGVTFFEPKQKLMGKFAFLVSRDTGGTNSADAAAIYEFDLAEGKLSKICNSPWGTLLPPGSGGVFCVIFQSGIWSPGSDTNVFLYSKRDKRNQTLSFESPVLQACSVGGHVYVVIDRKPGTSLMDYDLSRGQTRQLVLSNASRWQYQRYDRIHVPRESTNILHFYYKGHGKRLADGTDYEEGYYELESSTGSVHRIADLLGDNDDESHRFRTADGRYLFFEGPDMPASGFRLMSSSRRDFGNNREKVGKLVRDFSKSPTPFARPYHLRQISPDGKYALVALEEPAVLKSPTASGWMSTYFAVDAASGASMKVLIGDVDHTTGGSMSGVYWIP